MIRFDFLFSKCNFVSEIKARVSFMIMSTLNLILVWLVICHSIFDSFRFVSVPPSLPYKPLAKYYQLWNFLDSKNFSSCRATIKDILPEVYRGGSGGRILFLLSPFQISFLLFLVVTHFQFTCVCHSIIAKLVKT